MKGSMNFAHIPLPSPPNIRLSVHRDRSVKNCNSFSFISSQIFLNTRNIVKKAKKCNNKDLIFETESFPSFEIDTKSSMAKTMRSKKISVNFIKQNND